MLDVVVIDMGALPGALVPMPMDLPPSALDVSSALQAMSSVRQREAGTIDDIAQADILWSKSASADPITSLIERFSEPGNSGALPRQYLSGTLSIHSSELSPAPLPADEPFLPPKEHSDHVTVIGIRRSDPYFGGSGGESGYGEGGYTEYPHLTQGSGGGPPPGDHEVINVHILGDPLSYTEAEWAAIAKLIQSVRDVTAAINKLSDTATYVLPGGERVTGAELKLAWSFTDFQVYPRDHNFGSDPDKPGSLNTRGNVSYNDGNPVIRVNVTYLGSLDTGRPGGMNYFPLHELGHTTQVARDLMAPGYAPARDQRLANDTARMIATIGGIPIDPTPDAFGYTPGTHTVEEPGQ